MKRAVLLLSICMMSTQGVALCVALRAPDEQQPAAVQETGAKDAQLPPSKQTASRKPFPTVGRVTPERVYDVLRAVARESKHWKSASASASMQAQIADLLWDVEPDSSRVYLVQAWEMTTRIEEPRTQVSVYRNISPRTNSQREVISVARKRAPELAKKWLDEMAQERASEKDKSNSPRGSFDDRTQRSTVLLQLAMSAVEDNPQNAAELAIESLQDGISFGLQHVLLKLQEKKFELAQQVFNAALNRLRTVGMLDPNELLILHSYLYTPGTVSGSNTTNNPDQNPLTKVRNPPPVRAAAEVNPALGLEFLRLAADLLVNAPLPSTTDNPQLTARTQISVISFLQGKMSQSLPDQSVALQRRVQQMEADAQFVSTPQSRPADLATPFKEESRQDYAQRRVERLEELARKETDPLRRNIAYAKASLATAIEDYSRGLTIAGNIRDDALRGHIADWLYARASLHFARAANPDKAYELLKKINDPLQRGICLVVGAQQLGTAKDTPRAGQWLQEARAVIKSAGPEEALSHVALGVVSTYARFDNVAALESLADAVKLINQSPLASPAADKVPSVKRFSGLANADYTYGTNGFGLHSAIGAFKPDWFENVLESIGKINDVELRANAIVALCRKNLVAPNRSSL